MKMYRIEDNHGRKCIQVNNEGVIIDSSSKGDWMVGKYFYKIKEWAKTKGAKIEQLYNDGKEDIWNSMKL